MIRFAKDVDIDSMVELLNELFSIEEDFEFNPEKHSKGLSRILENKDRSAIFVYEEDSMVLGMCSVQLLISSVEGTFSGVVEDVVVKRGLHGKGMGRKLVEAAESWVREKGGTRVTLLADKFNDPALKFYEKLKFQTTRMICLKKQLG